MKHRPWVALVAILFAAPACAQPLLQIPGAVVVSRHGRLDQYVQDGTSIAGQAFPHADELDFSPGGDLYINDRSGQTVLRYEVATNTGVELASGFALSGFSALADRVVGGRGNSCGAYGSVLYADGAMLQGEVPSPCGGPWLVSDVYGDALWVLQPAGRLSRRSAASPGAVLQSYEAPTSTSDLAVTPDGTVWLLHGRFLSRLAPDGELLGTWSLSEPASHLAVREDGLLAVAGGGRVGFVRPDHGYEAWQGDEYRYDLDIVFVPGVAADADGDGLPLWWEAGFGLAPSDAGDAGLDGDGDGLTHAQEFAFRSRPNAADSDDDGADDGLEASAGTQPLDSDTDDDGLSDGMELVQLHSDPLSSDSDDDGLGDMLEALTLHSDPNLADSDGDGMPDGWEHGHGLGLVVDDAGADRDGDGLANLAEYLAGCDPTRADTDFDRLNDGMEAALGSDPLDKDSDGDRLPDGWEAGTGHDLLLADSDRDEDGDSFTTLEEFWSGTFDGAWHSHPKPASWNMQHGSASHTGYQPHNLAFPVSGDAVLSVTVGARPHPAVQAGGMIFYSVSSGFGGNRLVALDAHTGAQAWSQELGPVYHTSPPAYAEGRVYVQTGADSDHGSASELHAFDAATGMRVFGVRMTIGGRMRFLAPTIVGDRVHVAVEGGAAAYHRVTGGMYWMGFTLGSLPAYAGGALAVGATQMYDYVDGHLEIRSIRGEYSGRIEDPAYAGDGAAIGMAPLLGGYDNAIVCQRSHMTSFDLTRRIVAWSVPGCANLQPTAANGLVFTHSGGLLNAYEEIDGAPAWSSAVGGDDLAYNILATRDHVIVSNASETFFVRLSDRSISQTLPVAGDKVLTEDGRLIVSTALGLAVYDLDTLDASGAVFFSSFE